MNTLLSRFRGESGQAIVFVAVILTALVGMVALVVDVGSWYRADRQLQTAADAAALAGAQELPLDQTEAKFQAEQYAEKNYAGIPAPTVTFPDAGTIDVVAEAETRGIFAPALNSAFDVVAVHAEAQARVFAPEQMKNVAPIAVHQDEACIVLNPDCYKDLQILSFDDGAGTGSKYGLLDLDRVGGKGLGDSQKWLADGYPYALPINVDYPPLSGNKNGLRDELEAAADEQRKLLFPVFSSASASTGFHVIGWAAFVIEDVLDWNGPDRPGNHVLTGHFVAFIATDLAAGNPITDPNLDFGVHVITLTH